MLILTLWRRAQPSPRAIHFSLPLVESTYVLFSVDSMIRPSTPAVENYTSYLKSTQILRLSFTTHEFYLHIGDSGRAERTRSQTFLNWPTDVLVRRFQRFQEITFGTTSRWIRICNLLSLTIFSLIFWWKWDSTRSVSSLKQLTNVQGLGLSYALFYD